MMFGDRDTFAIEVGAVEQYSVALGLFVQFQFWIGGLPIGDWEDRIPLGASARNFETLCDNAENRRERLFEHIPATEVFQTVYDAFFAYDYRKSPVLIPNLRDRFHMDDIGLGSVRDKYGIVIVASSMNTERIIVKDLRQDTIIADVVVPFGFVESVGGDYINWEQTQLR
jgi:Immunity protein 42